MGFGKNKFTCNDAYDHKKKPLYAHTRGNGHFLRKYVKTAKNQVV